MSNPVKPGPVTQANYLIVLQARLAHDLRILDVGGAGDCFSRVVSHQFYGEPGCYMNVHYVGVTQQGSSKVIQ